MISDDLIEKLHSTLPEEILYISDQFHKNKGQLYLVGGYLRDFFYNPEHLDQNDIDLTTDLLPQTVTKMFSKVVPTGIKHGTVTIVGKSSSYEVTTFRIDGQYLDARRPQSVSYTTNLNEDLKRRDFTINAISYDIHNKLIIDNHGGIKDIKKGIIYSIGNSEKRFDEDALRMLRACRFSSQLNFKIHLDTLKAIQIKVNKIKSISKERIRDELIKILISNKPSIGIENIRISGLLSIILASLEHCYGVTQNKYHKYDVYYHILNTVDAVVEKDYRIRLAALFHDIAKPLTKKKVPGKDEPVFYKHELVGEKIVREWMKEYHFSNDDIKFVSHLVREHMFHYTSNWTDSAVRRFVKRIKVENISSLFALRKADRIGSGTKDARNFELNEFQNRINDTIKNKNALQLKDLVINGNDLINTFNLERSKKIGDILKILLEKVLDNPQLNQKKLLLEQVEILLENKNSYTTSL